MEQEQVMKKPPYLMIIILFVGAFIAFLNNTLLNVALPTIMKDLDVTYATVQWLATGYMLVSGVLIPASAYFITRYNTRPLFIVATCIFILGTAFAAFAPNFAVLLIGRMLQAVGASFMSPILMNVMLISFPVKKRGTAMGVFGLVMIAAPAIGPTLSGYIVEHYDWRMLFKMILPFITISLLLSIWKLKNVLPTKPVTLDYMSLALSSVGFGGVLYGFSSVGNKGWSDPIVIITLIIGVIGVTAFVIRQIKLETPMLSMEIFKSPLFSLSAIINTVIAMALMGGMILTPAYVQNVRGISPLDSGLLMLPGALVMAFMSPITGKLFDKFGPMLGLIITAVSTYMLSKLEIDTKFAHVVLIYSVRMFGLSLTMMPIMTNGLNSLPMRLNPHGTAANNTIQQVAGSIGTAILVAVMNNHATSVGKDLAKEAQAKWIGIQPTNEQIAQMKELIGKQALLEGIQLSFLVATIFTVIAFALSIFLKRAVKPGIKSESGN